MLLLVMTLNYLSFLRDDIIVLNNDFYRKNNLNNICSGIDDY